MAAGCTGGPFAEPNATKARSHAAQVKGGAGTGGIRVCGGVLDEQLLDALVTDLHRSRRNEKKEKTVHRALLSELAAAAHTADVTVTAEQSAQHPSASNFRRCCDISRRLSRRSLRLC